MKIKAHAKDGSGIAFYKFNVEKQIICDRLSTEQDEDKSVTATWEYLHPGDFVEFYVVATATDERANITIDVDGESIAIRETFPGNPISLINPFKYPFISAENDQFLLRFVQLWMVVTSHGEEGLPTWSSRGN